MTANYPRLTLLVVLSIPGGCGGTIGSSDTGPDAADVGAQDGSADGDSDSGSSRDGDMADSLLPGDAGPEAGVACLDVSATGAATGTVASPELAELSGLVVSRVDPQVLWVHNDSGDGPRFFAMSVAGELLGTFTLAGTVAVDWEDIAADDQNLYVGDIGDNALARAAVAVHRFPEPAVPSSPGAVTVEDFDTLTLVYPDGPHNSETLLVDPLTGDLFVVTKATDSNMVYRAAAPLPWASEGTVSLELVVDELPFERRSLLELYGGETTGGDISPLGDGIIIKDYWHAFYWPREAGQSVSDALAGEPCEIPLSFDGQGEAIGFDDTGAAYYTAPEQTSGFSAQTIRLFE